MGTPCSRSIGRSVVIFRLIARLRHPGNFLPYDVCVATSGGRMQAGHARAKRGSQAHVISLPDKIVPHKREPAFMRPRLQTSKKIRLHFPEQMRSTFPFQPCTLCPLFYRMRNRDIYVYFFFLYFLFSKGQRGIFVFFSFFFFYRRLSVSPMSLFREI